jgi:hypothetical protein
LQGLSDPEADPRRLQPADAFCVRGLPQDAGAETVSELSARDLVYKLVDVMRRSDPVWCLLEKAEATYDEEWDDTIAKAEDWLEDNP